MIPSPCWILGWEALVVFACQPRTCATIQKGAQVSGASFASVRGDAGSLAGLPLVVLPVGYWVR